ncbi:diacylglycerol pyrophosphate phosphatase 1 [Lentinula edodes]|uniref:Diacylglycerol pyrophosphate phosphatase 1 n=1 Tax=Lentinula edodes TaxID=5353 RepID=A0A1Q3ETB4_LENED|nr:diacylglycerol pyrophosphate phosphatase 1 [Lentinula edodes]
MPRSSRLRAVHLKPHAPYIYAFSKTRLFLSYAVDWTILIVVALFAHFYLNRLQQFPEFDLTDTSIQYSIKEVQTVSNGLLIAVLVIPYLSIVAGNLLFNFRDWWDLHASLLGLSISYSASGSFVQFSTDSAFIKDGMRSFFSGHAILSAAGLGFMSLYWGGKLHLFNQKAYTYKVWLVFSPLILSIWICLTRVADRRHHWNDAILPLTWRSRMRYTFSSEGHVCGARRYSWWIYRGPEGELESLGFMTTPFDSRHENGAENYPLNRRTSIPPTTS